MKLTIGRKLTIGFSILIFFYLLSIGITYVTMNQSQEINDRNSNVYVPSMRILMEFNNMIIESEKLIGNWIFIQSHDDTRDKNRLRELNRNEYPIIRDQILEISQNWTQEEQEELEEIFGLVDLLFITQRYVMEELSDFGSYDDPMVFFEIRPMMEPGGTIVRYTAQIVERLQGLIELQQGNVELGRIAMNNTLDSFRNFSLIIAIIMVVGGIITAIIFVQMITRPVISLRNVLSLMGQGRIPEKAIKEGRDEIGEMAKALNFLIEGIKEKIHFATEIGKGNFSSDFKPLSDEDTLGLSLVNMRESLQKAKEEEEKRQVEDAKRNWATQGVAKFAELLRQNNDDIKELSFNIIKNLVNYLDANQGGVFILDDEENGKEKYVELAAAYAYERRKYLKKKINWGEGLVGTCLQEGETIFLTEVPDSYISIRSGLGDSNPRCILIVPLKLNDDIYGVLEIASFKVLDPYQIEFVEKVGESIASTISSVKINIRTTELLHQSQEQSEEMRAQEEEMRQNMEEMHATQEEMERKEVESQGFFNAINHVIPFTEMSLDGKIKKINEVFAGLTGINESEIETLTFSKLFDLSFMESKGFVNPLDMLNAGETLMGDFKVLKRDGDSLQVKGAFKPVMNKYNVPIKIVFVVQQKL